MHALGRRFWFSAALFLIVSIAAAQTAAPAKAPVYLDPSHPIDARVDPR